jgi:hypothetical protein
LTDCVQNSDGELGKAYRIVMEKHLVLVFTWMTKKVRDHVKMLIDTLGIACEDSNIIEVRFSFGSRSVGTLVFFLFEELIFIPKIACIESFKGGRGGGGCRTAAPSSVTGRFIKFHCISTLALNF